MLKQQNQNMFWFCCFRKPGWKQENRFGNTQNQKSAQNKNRDSPTVMESGSPADGGPDRTGGLDSMLQQQRWTIRWLVWSSVRQQPIQTSEPDLKASWVLPASQFSADPVERHGAGNPVASSTELTAGTEVKLKGPAATESTSDYQFCYTELVRYLDQGPLGSQESGCRRWSGRSRLGPDSRWRHWTGCPPPAWNQNNQLEPGQ